MKVGLARISTDRDNQIEVALAQQIGRLKDAGAIRIYADIASREDSDRTSVRKLIEDIQKGEITEVLITRLDRVTSSPGFLEYLSDFLKKHNVKLIALDECLDLTSVDGEFKALLDVVFARREVRTAQLRVKKGVDYKKSKNQPNNCVPWGYTIKNQKYCFDNTPFLCLLEDKPNKGEQIEGRTKLALAQDFIEMFFDRKSLGKTVKDIHLKYGIQKIRVAGGTNKIMSFVLEDSESIEKAIAVVQRSKNKRSGTLSWCESGLKKWLLSPVLVGDTPKGIIKKVGKKRVAVKKENWEISYNTHQDKLLTRSQQQEIEEILKKNQNLKWGVQWQEKNLLTGLVFCSECGATYKAQAKKTTSSGVHRRYQCREYSARRACPGIDKVPNGTMGMIRESTIEAAIIDTLCSKAEEIVAFSLEEQEEKPEPIELIKLRQELEKINSWGDYPEIKSLRERLKLQIQGLEDKHKLKSERDQELEEILIDIFSSKDLLTKMTENDRRETYKKFVDKVIVEQKVIHEVFKNGNERDRAIGVVKEVILKI